MFRIDLYLKFYKIKIKIIAFMLVFNKETDGLIYYIYYYHGWGIYSILLFYSLYTYTNKTTNEKADKDMFLCIALYYYGNLVFV